MLAAIPYAALQVDRGVRAVLRGFGGVPLVVLLLLVAATVPVALEGAKQQPIGESVDGLRDGFSGLAGWVRMSGRIVTLTSPEAVDAGQQVQSLLIEPSGDAILILSPRPLDSESMVTGRVSNSSNASEVAHRVGGDRVPDEDLDIIDQYVLTVDDPIVPPQARDWTLTWILLLAAGLLAIGRMVGYPVSRMSREPGLGHRARPLAVGESVPVRVVERQDETGTRLRAPRGVLRRLERRDEADPYFSLAVEGLERPLLFRRHRWSSAVAGTLSTLTETVPVVEVRDWGLEVMMAVESDEDRDRVLASFDVGPEAIEEPRVAGERMNGRAS